MEYVYATLTLNETGAEINETNLTNVLEAAEADVVESRVKAIVAALEEVDLESFVAAAGNGAPTTGDDEIAVEATDEADDPMADTSDDTEPFETLDLQGEDSDADDETADASDSDPAGDTDEIAPEAAAVEGEDEDR